MFDIDRYLDDLIRNCQTVFGERLLYVGLQGSYLKGRGPGGQRYRRDGDPGPVHRGGYGCVSG